MYGVYNITQACTSYEIRDADAITFYYTTAGKLTYTSYIENGQMYVTKLADGLTSKKFTTSDFGLSQCVTSSFAKQMMVGAVSIVGFITYFLF